MREFKIKSKGIVVCCKIICICMLFLIFNNDFYFYWVKKVKESIFVGVSNILLKVIIIYGILILFKF